MNTQHFTNNDNQKFPLSTETLAFMQEQIKLAYGLTDLAGQNIIVKQSSATETGLVIYDGELLPLTGTPSRFITIAQSTEQVNVEGRFTGTVRTTRTAVYASVLRVIRAGSGTGSKAASSFTILKSISTLMSELDEAKQHVMPKGSVIAWSGTCDCDHVPYGFVPCGAFFTGSASQFAPGAAGTVERDKWTNKYTNIEATLPAVGTKVGIRITQCNGVTIPDLTDRFIVQAGGNYAEGDTGGANSVTLNMEQIPAHKHIVPWGEESTVYQPDWGFADGYSNKKGAHNNDSNNNWPYTSPAGGKSDGTTATHENRPPFYALCYLIKVI